jgi:hypothetical protein
MSAAAADKEAIRRGPSNDIAVAAQMAGWPTPTVRDHKDGASVGTVPDNALLGRVAWQAGWNTPRATDGSNGGPNQANGALSADVSLAGWPTPVVNDATGSQYAYSQGNHDKPVLKLPGAVRLAGPARITASGQMLTGSTAAMESGGQLAPSHSRWLMGLPIAWDFCAISAWRSLKRK